MLILHCFNSLTAAKFKIFCLLSSKMKIKVKCDQESQCTKILLYTVYYECKGANCVFNIALFRMYRYITKMFFNSLSSVKGSFYKPPSPTRFATICIKNWKLHFHFLFHNGQEGGQKKEMSLIYKLTYSLSLNQRAPWKQCDSFEIIYAQHSTTDSDVWFNTQHIVSWISYTKKSF